MGCSVDELTTLVAMIGVLKSLYWVNIEEIEQMNESKLSYGTKDGDMLSLLDLYSDFQSSNSKRDVKEWAKRNYVCKIALLSFFIVLLSFSYTELGQPKCVTESIFNEERVRKENTKDHSFFCLSRYN